MDELDYVEEIFQLYEIPRPMKDRSNPLEQFSDQEIQKRYRFSKNVIVDVLLPLIAPHLETPTNHGCPVPVIIQLLTALQFYNTGSFQLQIGDSHELVQGSVSKIVKIVSNILAENLQQYVHFPPAKERAMIRNEFEAISGFPRVVGCIDGTHIPIECPNPEIGEEFRNRKGTFLINVQVVAGPKDKIFNIIAWWPGLAHDSRIFQNSGIRHALENDEIEGIILGDSGYPQRRYLCTPVINPVRPIRLDNIADPNYIIDMFAYRENLRDYCALYCGTTEHIVQPGIV